MMAALITAPSEEPVSLDEAKDHLRVDGNDEDALIMGLVKAARRMAEMVSRRAFMPQTWELALEAWPEQGAYIELPYPPLQSVTSVKYIDSAGVTQTMPSADYVVDAYSEPGRVWLGYGKNWPTATLRPGPSILIRFVAGYGAAVAVPEHYKQAIKLLIGHFHENREAVVATPGMTIGTLPLAVDALLMVDRGNW